MTAAPKLAARLPPPEMASATNRSSFDSSSVNFHEPAVSGTGVSVGPRLIPSWPPVTWQNRASADPHKQACNPRNGEEFTAAKDSAAHCFL